MRTVTHIKKIILLAIGYICALMIGVFVFEALNGFIAHSLILSQMSSDFAWVYRAWDSVVSVLRFIYFIGITALFFVFIRFHF